MNKYFIQLLLLICLTISCHTLLADAIIDEKAPYFVGKDLQGVTHRLSDYAGKIVVLEWSSPECPYSRRYYENGTLNSLYEFARKNDIVWINIVPKLQKLSRQKAFKSFDASNKIVIVDDSLDISTAYGAQTTPQIFIINKEGILSYTGAIDSSAMLKVTASNTLPYTHDALDDLLANREVHRKITRVLGCFVQNNAQSTNGLPAIDGSGSR